MLNLFYIVKCFFSSLQVLTFYVVRTNCRAGRRKSGFESLFVNLVQLYGISKLSTVNRECCNVTALNIKGMALLWHLGLLEQEMFKDCWNSFSTFLSLLLTMMLTIFFFFFKFWKWILLYINIFAWCSIFVCILSIWHDLLAQRFVQAKLYVSTVF